MKTVRWLTPVLFVLFVGVLMAPVPSEAAPTLTLALVDVNGNPLVWPSTTQQVPEISIPVAAYSGSCSDATTTATTCWQITRDTYCPDPGPPIIGNNQLEPRVAAPLKVRASGSAHEWFVPGSSNPNLTRVVTGLSCTGSSASQFQKDNAWTIGDYSQVITPTDTTDDFQHARLIVIDNSGAAVDKLKLSWVTFKPVTTGLKRLVVKFSNDFTTGVNTGTYVFGLESGGMYKAVGAGNTLSNNKINSFSGTGFFDRTLTAPVAIGTPLTSSVPSPTSATLTGIGVGGSAAMTQNTLSSFTPCNYPSGTCKPSITLKLDFTVNNDAVGAANSFGGEAVLNCGEGCSGTINDLGQSLKAAAVADDKALRSVCSNNYQGACIYVGLPGPNQ